MTGELGPCKHCSRQVRWVLTSSGYPAPPLEPDPHPLGCVVLDEDGRTGGDGTPDMSRRYLRHFCEEYGQKPRQKKDVNPWRTLKRKSRKPTKSLFAETL